MAFLSAHWKDLILINYVIPPELVKPYLPTGCQIDFHQENTYASLVLFEFLNTKVLGIKWPGHVNFTEINLRLYVTCHDQGQTKRGVIFVKELVPRPLIAWIARNLYQEPYEATPITHHQKKQQNQRLISYQWQQHQVTIASPDTWQLPQENSHEQFIIEHYWGYTKINDHTTNQYQVSHPSWQVTPIELQECQVDFGKQYGQQWAFLNQATPHSVFMAKGSQVEVMPKKTLKN